MPPEEAAPAGGTEESPKRETADEPLKSGAVRGYLKMIRGSCVLEA